MTGGTLPLPRPAEQGTHQHRFIIPVEWKSWPAYDTDGRSIEHHRVIRLRCECGKEEIR